MDPFVKTNNIILRILGHWPYQSDKKRKVIRSVGLFCTLSCHLPMWIRVYDDRNNFDDLLLSFPMAVTGVLYYTSLIFFITKTTEIFNLFEWIKNDYRELETHEAELKILKESAAEGHYAVKLFAYYTGFSTVGYCIEALIPQCLDFLIPLNETREKMQLAEMNYVFFDVNAHFYFAFFHISTVGAFIIATIVAADLMLYTLCQHACGMFRVLRYQITDIKNMKNVDEIYLKGVACVKFYNRLLEYIKMVDKCYTIYLLVAVGIEILLMSFQGAMIVMKFEDKHLVSLYGTYYLAQLIHVLYNCIPGQNLLDHGREITNYICFSEWYTLPERVKKLFLMIMTRSIKESKITIGNVFPLCIETYSSIMKTIFSYLSVLTSMKD